MRVKWTSFAPPGWTNFAPPLTEGPPTSQRAPLRAVSKIRRRGKRGTSARMRPTSTLLPSIVRCAATVSPSHPELTHQRTHFPDQLGNLSPPLYRLAGIAAVPPVVAVATRRSGRWAAVHPAALPAAHRGGLAWRPAPRLCTAPGRQEPGRMHGVDRRRWGHAPPPFSPLATAPTIACPPSFTVTCSTRTVCCPVRPLWRFNVSTIIVKVRVSLFP